MLLQYLAWISPMPSSTSSVMWLAQMSPSLHLSTTASDMCSNILIYQLCTPTDHNHLMAPLYTPFVLVAKLSLYYPTLEMNLLHSPMPIMPVAFPPIAQYPFTLFFIILLSSHGDVRDNQSRPFTPPAGKLLLSTVVPPKPKPYFFIHSSVQLATSYIIFPNIWRQSGNNKTIMHSMPHWHSLPLCSQKCMVEWTISSQPITHCLYKNNHVASWLFYNTCQLITTI